MGIDRWFDNPQVQHFIQDPRTLLASIALIVTVVAGFFAIKRLRPTTQTFDINREDLADNFEELHRGGMIKDVELRRIKSVLGNTQGTRSGNSAQQGG